MNSTNLMDYKKLVVELKDKGLVVGDEITGFRVNPYLEMPKSLNFSDVSILQSKNAVNSRSDVSIVTEVVRGHYIALPFISANMSTVTDGNFCALMSKYGGLGVLHRAYRNVEDYLAQTTPASIGRDSATGLLAASVGVGPAQFELAKRLIAWDVNTLVIDIAHGYSNSVKEMAIKIKQYSKDTNIIVGNTNNVESLYFYNDVADAVKVGIANGLACETKVSAGASENQFTTVLKFKEAARKLGMPIISDGGIRNPSDAVKAIAAGASAVMMGSVFARCPESAAKIDDDGKKIYYGMASRASQEAWYGKVKNDCPEGKVVRLSIGEPLEALLKRYAGALRSGITYAGASNIQEFQDKVKFVKV